MEYWGITLSKSENSLIQIGKEDVVWQCFANKGSGEGGGGGNGHFFVKLLNPETPQNIFLW